MELFIAIVYLLIGFAILIYGGDYLVQSAVSIAARLEVSPAIIGLTIIAAGTSAPELMTSLLASQKGSPDIALGNVVGSNIFNILAILGVSSMLSKNKVPKSLLRFEIPMLILLTALFVYSLLDNQIQAWEGFVLIFFFVGFTYYAVQRARKRPQTNDNPTEELEKLKNWYHDLGYLIAGIAGLVGGAQLALIGGADIGRIAGLSERIIGITILSVGTGLPELATSAVASLKGQDDIAISNVIGSNIMNTLLVVGATSAIRTIPVSNEILNHDVIWMTFATVSLLPILILNKRAIGRRLGAAMTLSYIAYISSLIF